ncbi:hypothetical protein WMY93_007110 [Mugilogobius chulae]|uniref:NACHT domain-containing protein n=1 Tax=Mugilogobius chulae TaxID=88201 RepID=A0AAW0PMK1_9GOBI
MVALDREDGLFSNQHEVGKYVGEMVGDVRSVTVTRIGVVIIDCKSVCQRKNALDICAFEKGDQLFRVNCFVFDKSAKKKGVVSGVPVAFDEELFLNVDGVCGVRRLMRTVNGERDLSTSVCLSFREGMMPDRVYLDYICYRVRPFERGPLRCFACQEYDGPQISTKGHPEKQYKKLDNLILPINISRQNPDQYLVDQDILKCDCKHNSGRKTVLTFGPCGIGKTTAVHKVILDWVEGRAHTHLCFRDLKGLSAESLSGKNVWFVFDELDDIKGLTVSYPVYNISEATFAHNLLPNLIVGNLLPDAHIWITSRDAAVHMIPEYLLIAETEIKGFNDEQKEQHIRNVVGDVALANRVTDHIKISRSLFFLCQIPTLCTIMATVLKKHVKTNEYKIRPMTLTQIYSSLIDKSQIDFIFDLGLLAVYTLTGVYSWTSSEHLLEGKKNPRITLDGARAFAREHPLVFTEKSGVFGQSIFCFAHISVLEYFVAVAKLNEVTTNNRKKEYSKAFINMIHKEEKLGKHGEYDICFRFFFGLIKERGILQSSDPFFAQIRKEILNYSNHFTHVSRFQWLREFDSKALHKDLKTFYLTGRPPLPNLALETWLEVFRIITNVDGLFEKFQMELPTRCDEKVLRSLPALLKSKKAMLQFSNLSDACCPALASVLSTKDCFMNELDLGFNSITDRGVESLVLGLSDQHCNLKSLCLQSCELTSSACEHLATALKHCTKLKELDLSCNNIGDVGLKHLAGGLESPTCQLETLKLSQCNIKREGGFHLASWLDLSINKIGNKAANELFTKMYYCGLTERCCAKFSDALRFKRCYLVELNLSSNNLKNNGADLLYSGLLACSILEKLNISRCGFTEQGGVHLSSILNCIPMFANEKNRIGVKASELKEVDLSRNKLTDDAAKHILSGLSNPFSHLQKISLIECDLTSDCCSELASQLSSSECLLTELDLSSNNIQDRGVKKLCVALKSPKCQLQKLFLRNCGLTSSCVCFLDTSLKTTVT